MSIITLLTDFGTDDEYVGIMKGVILSINPSVVIVDITHQIDPQDLKQAAYLIESTYRFFPEGTIHVIVVDPGVGSERAILIVEIKDHIFIAPDNGVLTLLIEAADFKTVTRVENSSYFLEPVSPTFHGRDIFAPVAAHLSKGVAIRKFGPSLAGNNLVRLAAPKPFISDAGALIGSIVSIDRFGNLITDIDLCILQKYGIQDLNPTIMIAVGEHIIKGISRSYASAKPNSPLAIVGSRGFLEIAVNNGSAETHFKVQKGDAVSVSSKDSYFISGDFGGTLF